MNNPFDNALDTARSLAGIDDLVPTVLLEAAAEALRRSADHALTEIEQNRGRRGNPERRAKATADLDLARHLRESLHDRRRTHQVIGWPTSLGISIDPAASFTPTATHTQSPTEEGLDLGVKQWGVVIALAHTWTSSAADLYMVARVTVPHDTRLNLDDWLQQRRRRLAHNDIGTTQSEIAYRLSVLRSTMKEAERAMRRADEHRNEAQRLTELLHIQLSASRLTDPQLLTYEDALKGGATPGDALAAAHTAEPSPNA